ncbi:MAG: hypothetical protein V1706_08370 [Pseudomonadota bacterium]
MDLSDFKKHDKKILKGSKKKDEFELSTSTKKAGRPKNEVIKKRINLYFPEDLLEVIDENCEGNRSYFAIKVFKYYFDQHKIKY